jgi:hypothetical protein
MVVMFVVIVVMVEEEETPIGEERGRETCRENERMRECAHLATPS